MEQLPTRQLLTSKRQNSQEVNCQRPNHARIWKLAVGR
jgi:hypothetical protein